jgi:hypothetical protein
LITASGRSIAASGIKPLTCWFNQTDRPEEVPRPMEIVLRSTEGRGIVMKKFGFASIIATGFAAAVLGLAGTASADVDHHQWINDIQQRATVGSVTATIGDGR